MSKVAIDIGHLDHNAAAGATQCKWRRQARARARSHAAIFGVHLRAHLSVDDGPATIALQTTRMEPQRTYEEVIHRGNIRAGDNGNDIEKVVLHDRMLRPAPRPLLEELSRRRTTIHLAGVSADLPQRLLDLSERPCGNYPSDPGTGTTPWMREVPHGSCSNPRTLPSGSVTVATRRPPPTLRGGSFTVAPAAVTSASFASMSDTSQ